MLEASDQTWPARYKPPDLADMIAVFIAPQYTICSWLYFLACYLFTEAVIVAERVQFLVLLQLLQSQLNNQ